MADADADAPDAPDAPDADAPDADAPVIEDGSEASHSNSATSVLSAAASGSANGDEGKGASVAELVARLCTKLAPAAPLSLSAHQSIARTIARLRLQLDARPRPAVDRGARFGLLCAGIHVHRRAQGSMRIVARGGVADAGADSKEELESTDALLVASLMLRTSACMLVLCAMAEWPTFEADADGALERAARALMDTLEVTTLEGAMLPPPPRKRNGTEAETAEAERLIASWQRALAAQLRPDRVARAALRSAAAAMQTPAEGAASNATAAWRRLETLAPVFFRNSADAMAFRMLLPDGDADFVSLDAGRLARLSEGERSSKLAAIAQAAESESGQSVARSLMLSFLLPPSVVGTRRSLLLSRQANTQAMIDHPNEVERAHNLAMAGTEWIFDKGADDLERAVALLAGVAMLTTEGSEEGVRKGSACDGRVQLPFFETPPPAKPSALRLAFVPHLRRWVLYRLDKRGKPAVVCSQRGFEGLCTAALLLVESLRAPSA